MEITRYWTARAHRLDQQFLRYLLVGAVAALADSGTLVLMVTLVHLHYLIGNAAGFAVGILINYALSIRWVFAERRVGGGLAEFAVFAGIGIVGLGISELVMFDGVDVLGLPYTLAKAGAIGVTLVWNFCARRAALFSS